MDLECHLNEISKSYTKEYFNEFTKKLVACLEVLQKTLPHTLLPLVSKIVKSLQCLLNRGFH